MKSKPESPWIRAAVALSNIWKDFATSLAKRSLIKKRVGDPPTPAQLLAAVQAAATNLATSVGNWDTAAAALQVALANFATAEADVVSKRETYDAANLAYIASILPPE